MLPIKAVVYSPETLLIHVSLLTFHLLTKYYPFLVTVICVKQLPKNGHLCGL